MARPCKPSALLASPQSMQSLYCEILRWAYHLCLRRWVCRCSICQSPHSAAAAPQAARRSCSSLYQLSSCQLAQRYAQLGCFAGPGSTTVCCMSLRSNPVRAHGCISHHIPGPRRCYAGRLTDRITSVESGKRQPTGLESLSGTVVPGIAALPPLIKCAQHSSAFQLLPCQQEELTARRVHIQSTHCWSHVYRASSFNRTRSKSDLAVVPISVNASSLPLSPFSTASDWCAQLQSSKQTETVYKVVPARRLDAAAMSSEAPVCGCVPCCHGALQATLERRRRPTRDRQRCRIYSPAAPERPLSMAGPRRQRRGPAGPQRKRCAYCQTHRWLPPTLVYHQLRPDTEHSR